MNEIANRPEPEQGGQLTVLDQASLCIRDMREEFTRLLGGVNPDRFERAVLAALASNPDLLAMPSETVMEACRKAAADRLVPDGKEGAIVVRWNERTRRQEATWQPMVRGIVKVAKLYAGVTAVDVELVYEGERFAVLLGDERKIIHERDVSKVKPGREIACYGIIHYGPGQHEREREVMSREQIEAIRMRSPAGKKGKGPWASDWGEMARKTVLHRLGKRLAAKDDGGSELLRQVIERVEEEYGDLGAAPDDAPAPRHEPETRAAAGRGSTQARQTRDVNPETGAVEEPATATGGAPLLFIRSDGEAESYTDAAKWRADWLKRIAAAAKSGGDALSAMMERNNDALSAAARTHGLSVDAIRAEAAKLLPEAGGEAGAAPSERQAPVDPWHVPFDGDWKAWGPAIGAKLAATKTLAEIKALQAANQAALERLAKEQPKAYGTWSDKVVAHHEAIEREAAERQPPEPLD